MQIKTGKTKEWKKIQREWSGDEMNEAILTFAKRWAERMEKDFKGTFNHQIALRTKKEEVGVEDLTNHMYCYAVKLLANIWIFGEELQQWHNIVSSKDDLNFAIKTNVEGGIILV